MFVLQRETGGGVSEGLLRNTFSSVLGGSASECLTFLLPDLILKGIEEKKTGVKKKNFFFIFRWEQ